MARRRLEAAIQAGQCIASGKTLHVLFSYFISALVLL